MHLRHIILHILFLCCIGNLSAQNTSLQDLLVKIENAYNNSEYQVANEVLETIKTSNFNKNSKEYGLCMLDVYLCMREIYDYNNAVYAGKEALPYIQKEWNKIDYASFLNSLSITNSDIGNYSEAIRLCTEALQIREKALGKEHPNYALSLNNLADYNSDIGNYSEAIRLCTEALQIREKALGKEHPNYALSLSNLANYNSYIGNYSEAIRLGTEALQIREKTLGKEHTDYALSLNNLATYNAEIGNYSEAIRLGTEALQIREKTLGKEHPDYALSLNNLATYNADLGNNSEAIRLGTEALQIREKTLGKEHPKYALSLSNLANYNSYIGNYSEAIRLGTEAMQIREKTLGKEHPEYATSLDNLANYNSYIGNYSEAIRLGTEAIQIREKILGKEHPNYALSLSNIATYDSHIGNYSEAIRLGTEAMQIWEKTLGKEHPDYAISLSNLANYNSYIGNYSEAIRLGTEAIQIREKTLGKEHPDYATSLDNLANYDSHIGNYSEAIRLGTEALQIREKTLGKEHPVYAISLSNLAWVNIGFGDLPSFEKLWTEAMQCKTNIILSTFQGLTLDERNSLWQEYSYAFEHFSPDFAYQYQTQGLITCAYNGVLLYKGLLLNAELETKNIISKSNDKQLISLYDEMKQNRMMLNKLLEKPVSERFMNADSLSRVITAQDRELQSRSKEYGTLKANMAISMKDVQAKLGKEDIAIEFVTFQHGKDSIMYAALTLKKGYDSPKMVPLFEQKRLDIIRPSMYYKTSQLYNLVWRPLSDELQGVKNVYFAPSGKLHNINIEVLPVTAKKEDGRKYYRLSSTRELAHTYIDEENASNSAAVYGGLKYNCSVEETTNGGNSLTITNIASSSSEYWQKDLSTTKDSISLRSGWDYLPGTLKEAQGVNENMRKARMDASLYVGEQGTEASFKRLSGQGKQMMHISTHGFYYTEQSWETQDHKLSGGLHEEISSRKHYEDKMLTRSGLLLAGCANALSGKQTDKEDGILYANEIAQLDFRGLDHVTLSACETGLGEITGEGVFGLQRGFKKAGAHSILMSLWKVEDNATQLLMNRFYSNCLERKMPKAAALEEAQDYLRNYEVEEKDANGNKTSKKKYADPTFWASFILLDGVNK